MTTPESKFMICISRLQKMFVNHGLIRYKVIFCLPNGLRYLRWGGDGEAVQPEKG
jgi:hypothetical protein